MTHPTSPMPQSMLTGLFTASDSAERAYRCAVERGYQQSEINLLMSDETRERYFRDAPAASADLPGKATEQSAKGSKLGGPVGGTASTIAPVVAAVGTLLLIPGFIVAGPVVIALAAAGAVGVAGGVIGMLTDWGIPKARVEEYEAGIRAGGILLGVKPHSSDDAGYLEQQWKASGGRLVHS